MHCCRCPHATGIYRKIQKSTFSRYCSAVAASTEVSQKAQHGSYICDNDPTQHTTGDYMKFYTIPNNDAKTTLTYAVPRLFKELSRALNENTFLLRKPSLNVISTLEATDTKPPVKFLLYGPDGGGKSLSLLHIMQYCLLKDWVVLYVPNAFRFADSQRTTQVQECQWKTMRVDQPDEAATWLNIFKIMNQKFLLQTNTTQDYNWGKRESTEKGRPLMEVIDQGMGRNLYSSDAVGVILKEIRQNEQLTVLYAVDAFNGFFGNTSHKLNGKLVDIESLSLIHHFTKLLQPEYSLAKGSYVMALSQSVQYLKEKKDPLIIDNQLDASVLARLSNFTEVEVPNYNDEEYRTIMNFYKEKGWLARDLTEQVLKEVQFMTQRNPTLVSKFCASL